ncbi:hypothetical protein [Yinghuangia seranimata]|uniref:hypothetical protein n=1 Tax=Yinghuangia seranimata TaxID=408067 RepID=UPI00248D1652|nr:hypothetical protein [Yinghuangia seranimata]MDI2128046.1 hypothetical protein [Yinghuangia seranimata]
MVAVRVVRRGLTGTDRVPRARREMRGARREMRGGKAFGAFAYQPPGEAPVGGVRGHMLGTVTRALAASGYPRAEADALLFSLRDAVLGDDADRDAAADVLGGVPARTLVDLDELSRSGSVEALGGLRERRALLRRTDHPAVAALSGMDENGGLREEAVVRLAARPGPLAAAVLALRTDDWVEPVRRRARIALMWRMEAEEAAVILPLLELRRGRSRASGVLDVYREACRGDGPRLHRS